MAVLSVALYYLGSYFIDKRFRVLTKTPKELQPQYEYIVVGGGTAGVILATLLSEDPSVFVLLLEAGEQASFFHHLPILRQFSNDNEQISVDFNASSSDGSVAERWSHGRVLGGSAMLKGSSYYPPLKHIWDEWAQKNGFSDLWPSSWLSSTSATDSKDQGGRSEDDVGGQRSITERIREAAAAAELDAFTFKQKDIAKNVLPRGSKDLKTSVLSYLDCDVQSRFNLHIVTGAQVTKINFNMDGEATGVNYIYNGHMNRVLINREVILTAGAVSSPHLLLLSGIGPAEHLNFHKINVIHSLDTVGQHMSGPISTVVVYEAAGHCPLRNESFPVGCIQILCRTLVKYGGFNLSCEMAEHRELTVFLLPGETNGKNDVRVDITSHILKNKLGKCAISARVSLLNEFTSSTVKLSSADAFSPPLIELQPQKSRSALLVKAVMKLQEVFSQTPFSKLNLRVDEEQARGCTGTPFSENFVSCVIHNSPPILYSSHTSSCAMGNDPLTSVVDKRLRVHGIKGVRIADSSVLPPFASVPDSVYSVIKQARRAAEIINSDYKRTNR